MPGDVRLAAWARPYDRENLRADLLAGVTMAAILVPQAMAYALLAGLPPEIGLYAGILPIVVYAIFGSSLHLSVGPVALVSLLTLTAISHSAPPGKEVETAGILALMVGAASLLMGLARIGFLVNYISQPVLLGFTAAAALIIASSQLASFTGADAERGENFVDIMGNFFGALDSVHLVTLLLGFGSLALLVVWGRRAGIPAPLLVAIIAALISWIWGLRGRGVDVVGEIPRGLPAPRLSGIDTGALVVDLIPVALVITLVGYLESVAIARAYAQRLGYRLRPSQEMIAVGFSNVASGATGGMPVSGSFSRTAANVHAGARTPASTLICAALVVIVLMGLTPALEPLPDAALAAIILVAVVGLIDRTDIGRIVRLHRHDAIVMALAFLLTLALGVEIGLVIAVAISLLVIGRRGLRASVTERSIPNLPDSATVVEVSGPLTFANFRGLRRALSGIVHRRGDGVLRSVVVDLSASPRVDASAELGIVNLVVDYSYSGVRIHLVAPPDGAGATIDRSEALAAHSFGRHLTLREAVEATRSAD